MSELKVADFEPPAAYVYKIIKNVLPENMIMTKEARTAIVRAAGIFIFYITHGANDFCRESKRSTIYTADVINSLKYDRTFLRCRNAVMPCNSCFSSVPQLIESLDLKILKSLWKSSWMLIVRKRRTRSRPTKARRRDRIIWTS